MLDFKRQFLEQYSNSIETNWLDIKFANNNVLLSHSTMIEHIPHTKLLNQQATSYGCRSKSRGKSGFANAYNIHIIM